MDPSNYYQDTERGRLLAFGTILIVLGIVPFFARGVQDALIVFPVVGIVLLIAGILYKPRKKEHTPANTA